MYKNNGSLSAVFETKTGVKQGEFLSTLLFNICLNDFVEYLGVNSVTPTLNELHLIEQGNLLVSGWKSIKNTKIPYRSL